MRKTKLYERLLSDKDERIRTLVEERDWLRAALGRPSPLQLVAGNPDDLPTETHEIEVGENGGWESEVDEAEAIIAEMNISPAHLPEILEGLGYGDSTL